jgi:uncharacterized membrane protein
MKNKKGLTREKTRFFQILWKNGVSSLLLYAHLLLGLPVLSIVSGILYQTLFKRTWPGALVAFFLPFWFIPYRFSGIQRIGLWLIFGSAYAGIAYAASLLIQRRQTDRL